MKLDSAILKALGLDAADVSISSAGSGDSSATASKITAKLGDGSTKNFFMKTGSGDAAEIMFKGEYASLEAIHTAVPTLCPAPLAHGRLVDTPAKHFLITEHLDLSSRSSSPSGPSLAAKLAQLHTTPAPIPPGHTNPVFGFPATTCCGDTPQPNPYTSSWATFYAEHRLRFILRQCTAPDAELRTLVAQTADTVVPRLLGDAHLNSGRGVTPVVVHGDLWSGNHGVGRVGSSSSTGGAQAVVFDASACWAHSEFELGIMRMFGGFGRAFWDEYHALVPRGEPVGEFEDRMALYELYHHLNHYAMFGGGYRSGAVAIMRRLVGRYGGEVKGGL